MFRGWAKQMGWWQVNADTAATGRLVVSPLAEAIACLSTLHERTPGSPAGRAWLSERLPTYRARLADDPVIALLVQATLRPNWTAGCMWLPRMDSNHEPAG